MLIVNPSFQKRAKDVGPSEFQPTAQGMAKGRLTGARGAIDLPVSVLRTTVRVAPWHWRCVLVRGLRTVLYLPACFLRFLRFLSSAGGRRSSFVTLLLPIESASAALLQ
jgi:hypothetical protein